MGKKRFKFRARRIWAPATGLAAFLILLFILWQMGLVPEHRIYISSRELKQGDTVVIKISGKYPWASAVFAGQPVVFFKNSQTSDWKAILGIDTDFPPGEYYIQANAFGEKLQTKITVFASDFSSSKMILSEKSAQNIVKNDNPILRDVLSKITPIAYFDSQFEAPLVKMQKSGLDFGQLIKGPNGTEIRHLGVDLAAAEGTKVYAVNAGKAVLVKELLNYGKTVIVDHGLGIFSMYLHLSRFDVSEGDNVKKNQRIGLSGNTGFSTGPHLHFSMRDNGARVNPISFIKNSQQVPDSMNLAGLLFGLNNQLANWGQKR